MVENLLGSQPLINGCAPNEIAEKIKQLGVIKVSVHTPVYTMHKFWARRPWGVFRKIILMFTKPGDVILGLYSYWGETVLDPFLGTGTTCAVARRLGRNCIGYEIDLELREAIEERLGIRLGSLVESDKVEIIVREDARRLRTKLRQEIEKKLNERGR
jgi:hypothetical protein